jgi:hypothetical protein
MQIGLMITIIIVVEVILLVFVLKGMKLKRK